MPICLEASSGFLIAGCGYGVAGLSDGYSGDLIHDKPLFTRIEGVRIVIVVLALRIGYPRFVFLDCLMPVARKTEFRCRVNDVFR